MSSSLAVTVTPCLSQNEVRVLGCLIEKQLTTPEAYPLTLNALLLACNQKTSREPVLNLSAGQVSQALKALEEQQLARLQMGSRADRWEQRADKALELVTAQTALLGLLLLRGGQTLNELLSRSARLYEFDDVAQVQHHLERLSSRGLVVLLPRQSGQREERYGHCLAGEVESQAWSTADDAPAAQEVKGEEGRIAALEARVAELEQRLEQLEGLFNA
ncbi:YceH family protein [Pseudomonas sp. 5P_3.1_Bac2]|uniref:YceH family protein n=1 Tax=Pseudomonas sp. 5P_3.1_Bac2 TaxID=2971617 RepID=UPI0021C7F71D|nr:DUF480 domain-containing protein [Pseudomonas sp. 5P_3.1_Bac2]MCU1715783.1 DUF480 domain-containing protein [Pseudomonas sp. 5P_3.1_Bac2]